MRRIITITGSLLLFLFTGAQSLLRTVAPAKAIVAGESFQVQYIQEEGDRAFPVTTPDFKNFKKVAGPYSYTGTGQNGHTVFNTVYTLMPLKPGRFIIPGATISTDGRSERSSDVIVQVITAEEAAKKAREQAGSTPTAYYLAPGEDPVQKIKQNLFVKVTVDKRSCFPGEPVVAEFKLYSRLESRSDITRNPGFYGFTVYDMVSLTDQQHSTETVNGKLFSVHTIRKVQLFPQHEGKFSIDEMQIKHTVEFSTVTSSKPTEQQIAEGVLRQNDFNDPGPEGQVSYDYVSETQPLVIDVKPLPAGKPQGFSGAAGTFSIHTEIMNDSLSLHEEGTLKLIISGKGNFTQFSIPAMSWPKDIEGFEPVISDTLGKSSLPLSGARVFSYPFIPGKPGSYVLPAFEFSFFDPAKGNYSVIRTEPLPFHVSTTEKKMEAPLPVPEKDAARNNFRLFVYGLLALLFLIWIFAWMVRRKRKGAVIAVAEIEPEVEMPADHLQPARDLVDSSASVFCAALQQAIWNACSGPLHLAGSSLNKNVLRQSMKQYKVPDETVKGLLDVLEKCETVVYAGVPVPETNQDLLSAAEKFMGSLRSALL